MPVRWRHWPKPYDRCGSCCLGWGSGCSFSSIWKTEKRPVNLVA
jgi:hypothetical protein